MKENILKAMVKKLVQNLSLGLRAVMRERERGDC